MAIFPFLVRALSIVIHWMFFFLSISFVPFTEHWLTSVGTKSRSAAQYINWCPRATAVFFLVKAVHCYYFRIYIKNALSNKINDCQPKSMALKSRSYYSLSLWIMACFYSDKFRTFRHRVTVEKKTLDLDHFSMNLELHIPFDSKRRVSSSRSKTVSRYSS